MPQGVAPPAQLTSVPSQMRAAPTISPSASKRTIPAPPVGAPSSLLET